MFACFDICFLFFLFYTTNPYKCNWYLLWPLSWCLGKNLPIHVYKGGLVRKVIFVEHWWICIVCSDFQKRKISKNISLWKNICKIFPNIENSILFYMESSKLINYSTDMCLKLPLYCSPTLHQAARKQICLNKKHESSSSLCLLIILTLKQQVNTFIWIRICGVSFG
jgi:hypothetical protein